MALRADLEEFLNKAVQSGRYSSVEEALNEAVRLLKEMEEAESRLESLLQEAAPPK